MTQTVTATDPPITKSQLLALYRKMLVIRRTEEQLAKSHQQGLIHGACHTYVGEEAIATGVCANLRDDDAVFSTHRGHGHAIAKGHDIQLMLAELMGKESGYCHGRGGSMSRGGSRTESSGETGCGTGQKSTTCYRQCTSLQRDDAERF